MAITERIDFMGALGVRLAARLDGPRGKPKGYALFAHCFSCSKDVFAASRIAGALAERGIATLRFDFTGLGQSEGEFANTNFSSNVEDLLAAIAWMRRERAAPSLLIGHSLGGAAVLVAAGRAPEGKAVATIGAPAAAEHVVHQFEDALADIETHGEAQVKLAGRPFQVKKQFLEDVRGHNVRDAVAQLKRALLVLHAPTDATVGVQNATEIFAAAKHPKSFVSLDKADHLLTRREDAIYAANVIAAWAERYAFAETPRLEPPAAIAGAAHVRETRQGRYQAQIRLGDDVFLADEPLSVGGDDTGPAPFDWLCAGLGACTTMTLRMYAERKGLALDRASVEVRHWKESAADHGRDGGPAQIDVFERRITLDGALSSEERQRMLEIAEKCPVHRTLTHGAVVRSALIEGQLTEK